MDTTNTIVKIGLIVSTLSFGGGCAFEDSQAQDETVTEYSAAVSFNNSVFLNGVTENGGTENGGTENGGTENGGTENGGTENGGTENGGTENGGTENGGTENGGTENTSRANLVGRTFDLNSISKISVNGATVQPGWLYHAAVSSLLSGGSASAGSQLLGVEVTGKLDDGSTVTLRLDSVETFTSAGGDTLPRFVISYTRPGSNVRAFVCGKNNNTPLKTIPLTGRWNYEQGTEDGGSKTEDPTAITFACQGFALYKCVDIGYPPWKLRNGLKLNRHHQACTRMIRADYCGDGSSWTVNGTIINVYDNLGIQLDTESWAVEAEWNTNGARCLSHQRIQNMATVPTCSFDRSPAACGNPPQWGPTLFVSEAP
jgi:hypothetical protein